MDTAYRVGLEQKVKVNPATGLPLTTTTGGIVSVQRDATKAAPLQALGPGLAMTANPDFLDPSNPVQISYVTVAENNSDALGGTPVVLHIIKVDKTQRYRGSIATILSDNVFDENIVLRITRRILAATRIIWCLNGGIAPRTALKLWCRTDSLHPRHGNYSPTPPENQGLGFLSNHA